MRLKLLLLLILVGPAFSFAQTKNISHAQQTWLGYYNLLRFNKKWELSTDLHQRTKEDFVSGQYQSIIRFGISYYLNDATKLTAGYAFVNYFPGDNHKKVSQPERRPWQQLQWHTKFGKNTLQQRIRLEERYRRSILNDSVLATGYNFNWRLRYNTILEIPLGKKMISPFSLIASDEINVNFGKEILYNYFDQNRFFTGLKYAFNTHNNVQLGYMNIFQQLATGNKYRVSNVIRIYYYQNIDLRKKKGS